MAAQRNLKVAQALARDAEKKRAEAVRLAVEFDTAKNAAREAGQVRSSSPQLRRTAASHILKDRLLVAFMANACT